MRRAIGSLLIGGSLLLLTRCRADTPAVRHTDSRGARFRAPAGAPVITQASVVAFWLSSADTIPEAARLAAQDAFRRSNAEIADYLSDTDIQLVATVNDTLVIQLAGGLRRVVQLSGLDFPYGYVLVEPGYAEEFHTGLTEDQDLRDALDDYFGLDSDADSRPPKHRIAQHVGLRALLAAR